MFCVVSDIMIMDVCIVCGFFIISVPIKSTPQFIYSFRQAIHLCNIILPNCLSMSAAVSHCVGCISKAV